MLTPSLFTCQLTVRWQIMLRVVSMSEPSSRIAHPTAAPELPELLPEPPPEPEPDDAPPPVDDLPPLDVLPALPLDEPPLLDVPLPLDEAPLLPPDELPPSAPEVPSAWPPGPPSLASFTSNESPRSKLQPDRASSAATAAAARAGVTPRSRCAARLSSPERATSSAPVMVSTSGLGRSVQQPCLSASTSPIDGDNDLRRVAWIDAGLASGRTLAEAAVTLAHKGSSDAKTARNATNVA
jgi:hypothetical protein